MSHEAMQSLARKQVSSFFEFILSQVRMAQVVNFFQEPRESHRRTM